MKSNPDYQLKEVKGGQLFLPVNEESEKNWDQNGSKRDRVTFQITGRNRRGHQGFFLVNGFPQVAQQ